MVPATDNVIEGRGTLIGSVLVGCGCDGCEQDVEGDDVSSQEGESSLLLYRRVHCDNHEKSREGGRVLVI